MFSSPVKDTSDELFNSPTFLPDSNIYRFLIISFSF